MVQSIQQLGKLFPKNVLLAKKRKIFDIFLNYMATSTLEFFLNCYCFSVNVATSLIFEAVKFMYDIVDLVFDCFIFLLDSTENN